MTTILKRQGALGMETTATGEVAVDIPARRPAGKLRKFLVTLSLGIIGVWMLVGIVLFGLFLFILFAR